MTRDKSIEVLNSLVVLNNDRIAGYLVALKETVDEDLKFLMKESIQTSKECKAELTAEIEHLGGQIDDITRVNGKIFRAWMDFKCMVLRKDRKAVLNSCEYGEYVALHAYTKVLENDDLSSELHLILTAQFQQIQMDRDRILEVRNPVLVDA